MELKQVSLTDLSEIRYSIFLGDSNEGSVLVVAFQGTCGSGSAGNDDALFMRAIVSAGLAGWEPLGLVLDLRQLTYVMGDLMTGVLFVGDRVIAESMFPTTVVVSDRCREGLTSLTDMEMAEDPSRWLFNDLESAVAELEERMRSYYKTLPQVRTRRVTVRKRTR